MGGCGLYIVYRGFPVLYRVIGVDMRESILDFMAAVVLGVGFAVLALAYFDCLIY